MTVTKHVMAAGAFEIRLNTDVLPVPFSISDAFDINSYAFGHVLILPTRVDPFDFSDAQLLSMSVFTGIYQLQRDRSTLRGMHASGWLGDGNGKGAIEEAAITGTSTVANWIIALRPASLAAGTVSASAALLSWSTQLKTPRESIDYVVDAFGMEWEVTDQLTLNVNTVAGLYGSTPTVIATPWWDGRDNELTGIRATFGNDSSAEDYTTRVFLIEQGGAPASANGVATVFKDGQGNAVVVKRYVDGSSTVTAGTGGSVAAGQVGQWDQIDQHLTCTTDTFCAMADVRNGSTIFAYDPDRNIYDTANQVHYDGDLVFPKSLRVQGIEMNVCDGMGVLFRNRDGLYTDLSDHVAWEQPGARLEVGAPQATLSEAMRRRGIRA